jgi:hypothetical protein
VNKRAETGTRDATKYDARRAVPGCGKAAKRWLFRWAFFISCMIVLQACTIKAYPDPELPDNQLSTVSQPLDPALSWLLLFWFFPFNLLLPEDWKASSNARFTVDDWILDRFETLSLLPGRHTARAKRIMITDKTSVGSGRCGIPSVSFSKNKDGKTTCTRTTTCHESFRVTYAELECVMDFRTDAGRAYEIHIAADDSLVVTDADSGRIESSEGCFWSEPYTETAEEPRTVTDASCE